MLTKKKNLSLNYRYLIDYLIKGINKKMKEKYYMPYDNLKDLKLTKTDIAVIFEKKSGSLFSKTKKKL